MKTLRNFLLTCVVALAACGGSGSGVDADAPESDVLPQVPATVKLQTGTSSFDLVKVREERLSRTVYEYEFQVKAATPQDSTYAISMSGASTGTELLISKAYFAAGEAESSNNIMLRHDRSHPFDVSAWVPKIATFDMPPARLDDAVIAGWRYPVLATVGQPTNLKLTARVAGAAEDTAITRTTITNPLNNGTQPTMVTALEATWTPTAADIGTTELIATFELSTGTIALVRMPVDVQEERLLARIALGAETATYSDPSGAVIFKILGDWSAGDAIDLFERTSREGYLSYTAKSTERAIQVEFVEAPSQRIRANTGATSPKAGETSAGSRSRLEKTQLGLQDYTSHFEGISPRGRKLSGYYSNLLGVDGWVYGVTTRDDTISARLPIRIPDTLAGTFVSDVTAQPVNVIQVDATCSPKVQCKADGNPVILIHGFNPFDEIGGGVGTWNDLALRLRGESIAFPHPGVQHDVFEFRWHTYMRFEEAAGALSRLVLQVAEITKKKPTIIAHSFGGIVSHLALGGQGVEWGLGAWRRGPAVQGEVARLVTLGSPIAGISDKNESRYSQEYREWFDLPIGRDNELTINGCASITCVQAGATDVREESLLSLISHYFGKLPDAPLSLDFGESILRLKKSGHSVPTAIVVGAPAKGGNRDGDRLISLRGQVHPSDLPAAVEQASLLVGKADAMRSVAIPGTTRRYFLLSDGVHTNTKALHRIASWDVPEPYVSDDRIFCRVKRLMFCTDGYPIDHHLHTANAAQYREGSFWGILRSAVAPATVGPLAGC